MSTTLSPFTSESRRISGRIDKSVDAIYVHFDEQLYLQKSQNGTKILPMRIISKRTLISYWKKHPDTEQSLRAWHDEATKASWKTPQDIKRQYANASFVGKNRVVFNIKGNQHRLVVAVAYRFGALYIKFIGTHDEYDLIDVSNVDER